MNGINGYVGVISPFDLLGTSLKREALYFDSIAIPNIEGEFLFNDIEYLIQNGIVFDPVQKYLGTEAYLKRIGKDVYDLSWKKIEHLDAQLSAELKAQPKLPPFPLDKSLWDILSYPWIDATAQLFLNIEKYAGIPLKKSGLNFLLFNNQLDYDRRRLAADLRTEHSLNTFPLYSDNLVLMDDFATGNADVFKVVIQSIPEPDLDSVPWEQILDFRKDEEAQRFLCYFRHWANEVTKREVTLRELCEEIEYYCVKYEECIKLAKMKVSYGTLETLLMIPARIAEGFLALKPTKAVEALFTLQRQRIELHEAELEAPGRDLAYLLKVKEEFDSVEKHHSTIASTE